MTRDVEDARAATIHRMPKAELHVHLDGSLRPATLVDLAADQGIDLPHTDPDAIAAHMRVPAAQSLDAYLERFEITLSVLQTAESLERIAFELAADLAAEDVVYAEIRYSPILHTRAGLKPEETVESAIRGIERARRAFGIRANLIVCAMRHLPVSTSERLAELAGAYAGRGVVGFDLAGPEAAFPATAHAPAFRIARRHGLGATVHAGEADGPESIRRAIDDCQADRIGHGTRLFDDPALVAEVRDRAIPIEVCLTSNVQTGAATSYERHPLRRMFDAGLTVSLNTDNRLMSGTTVTREYLVAHRRLGFTRDQLRRISAMAIESAFVSEREKRILLDRLSERTTGTEAGEEPDRDRLA